MTKEDNIRAILETNFAGFREDIVESAVKRIMDIKDDRHGRWIIRDNPGTGWYRITCSECGEDVTSTAPCIGFFPDVKVIWNYCPDCGALMDEAEDE